MPLTDYHISEERQNNDGSLDVVVQFRAWVFETRDVWDDIAKRMEQVEQDWRGPVIRKETYHFDSGTAEGSSRRALERFLNTELAKDRSHTPVPEQRND